MSATPQRLHCGHPPAWLVSANDCTDESTSSLRTVRAVSVPDPNCFDGAVSLFRPGMENWQDVPYSHGYTENMRSIGVADLAYAIQSGRPNRCSGEMAYHVLDVMHAVGESSDSGEHVAIRSTCVQPAPLPLGLPEGKLDA